MSFAPFSLARHLACFYFIQQVQTHLGLFLWYLPQTGPWVVRILSTMHGQWQLVCKFCLYWHLGRISAANKHFVITDLSVFVVEGEEAKKQFCEWIFLGLSSSSALLLLTKLLWKMKSGRYLCLLQSYFKSIIWLSRGHSLHFFLQQHLAEGSFLRRPV